MRIRTIKPEFWSHPQLGRLPDHARLMAVGLITYADDEGYFSADPVLVRNAVRPFDENCDLTRDAMRLLVLEGFIELVDSERGALGRVVSFSKHQKISHRTDSRLKCYWPKTWENRSDDSGETPERLRSYSGETPERLRPDQGTGNREQGAGNEGGACAGGRSESGGESASGPAEPEPAPRPVDPDLQRIAMTVFGAPPAVLAEWVQRWEPGWVRSAMLATEAAGKRGAPAIPYCEAILRRYKREGGPKDGDCGGGGSGAAAGRNGGVLSREPAGKFAHRDRPPLAAAGG
jgi:hypothetical protein